METRPSNEIVETLRSGGEPTRPKKDYEHGVVQRTIQQYACPGSSPLTEFQEGVQERANRLARTSFERSISL